MDLTELRRIEELEAQLRAWDWRADLKADERSIPWLARKTDTPSSTVYSYSNRTHQPPLEWLRTAYRVLKGLDQ